MAATTTTSSASNFFHSRSPNHVDVEVELGCSSRVVRPHPHGGCANKLDGVAMWLMNGVANAFFASLQRCSCIRIATVDDHDHDDYDSSHDLPLIFNDGNLHHGSGDDAVAGGGGCLSRRKRSSKGKKGGMR